MKSISPYRSIVAATCTYFICLNMAVASSPDTLIDFEGPVYTAGSVGGQDSWVAVNYNVANNAIVTAANPISGSQSLLNDGTGSRSDVCRTFPLGTFTDGTTVKYLQEVLVDSTTGQGSGLYIGKDPGTGHDPVWVRFINGTIGVLTNGINFPFMTLGNYQPNKVYEITINLSFGQALYSVSVSNITDQIFVGSLLNVPMLPDVIPDPNIDSVGIALAQYDGKALLDNIHIIPARFPITSIAPIPASNQIALSWASRSSAGYAVDSKINLFGNWVQISNNVIAGIVVTNGLAVNLNTSITNANNGSQSFYRVRQTTAPTYFSTTVAATEAADAVYLPITNQTGTFTCTFDAWTSSNSVNQVIGLAAATPSLQTVYATLSCLVQLNTAGFFNVRSGGSYGHDNTVNYSANTKYSFRVVVNIPANTYSVYVTPDGGGEIEIAADYSFRLAASSLNYIMIVADHTSAYKSWLTVGNIQTH